MLIDTHAHYDHKRFDCGRYSLLEEIISSGVGKVVNPAIAFDSNYVMKKMQSRIQSGKRNSGNWQKIVRQLPLVKPGWIIIVFRTQK